jgi:hypothetical protein
VLHAVVKMPSDGDFRVQLELIEPALYLRHAPTSAARVFVAALLARL